MGKNRAPTRSQSAVKQTELFKTLQTLISQGIVEKSQSPHYSQILMVAKPDGTFRMCVDYRALNDCTADASWPIPNIAEMLRIWAWSPVQDDYKCSRLQGRGRKKC